MADQLKGELASFLNCNFRNISIQTNVAQSFSIVLHGLNWQKNDEVILVEEDYPSVTLPFQTLVNVKWVKARNGLVAVKDIDKLVSTNTRCLALSWVSYMTGQVQDIKLISDYCVTRNIRLLVDATQALGVIPISLADVHIDFVTASLYKGCFCPHGIAVSIFSDQFLSELKPISAGVFSQRDRQISYKPIHYDDSARQFEYGNLNVLGILLACETFKWFNSIGILSINNHLAMLSQGIIHILRSKSYDLVVDYLDVNLSGIVSFVHQEPECFMQRLKDASGVATYRDGLIRLSAVLYQSKNTLDKLAKLLRSEFV